MSLLGSILGRTISSAVPNTIEGVVVNALPSLVSNSLTGALSSGVSSALASSLGGLGAQAGANLGKQNYTGPQEPPLMPGETQVSGVDVPGSSAASPNLGAALSSAFSSAAPSLTSSVLSAPASTPALANISSPTNDNQVSGLDVTAPGFQPAESGVSSAADAFARNIGDLVPTTQDALHNGSVNDLNSNPALKYLGAGGLLGMLGLDAKSLLGLGLLGAGVMGQQGKTADTGAATSGLQQIAQSNQQTAQQLKDRALAGLSGNIGGMGMNYISRMVRNAQAAIRQRYSQMGMSGSSAETADLNAAVEAGVDQQFKIGQQEAQTGLSAVAALTGQSAQAYLALLNAATAKNTQLGNALANFAGAAAGSFFKVA